MEDHLKIFKVEYLHNHWLDLAQNWNLAMEDDLKISKVEYLSNHWLHLTQILNLNLGDETKHYEGSKWRLPLVEETSKS